MSLPSVVITPYGPWQGPPDPAFFPNVYATLTLRVLAYMVDVAVVAMLTFFVWVVTGTFAVLTFGLAGPLHVVAVALTPLAYHTLTIATGSATIGMRAFGLMVYSVAPGGSGRPTFVQAVINAVSFYGSVPATGGLVLLLALFNRQRRTLHDYLAGTVVLRKQGGMAV